MTRSHQRTDDPHTLAETTGRRGMTSRAPRGEAPQEFVAALNRSGLHDALGYLNARVRFRFTGVYRFEPLVLVNECLYDRENPALDQSGAILQLPDTYCAIARVIGDVFATENAPADPRLEGHSARHTVISYTGIPIRVQSGRIAGMLCHYDLRPRLLPREELGILQCAALYLAFWLGPSLSVARRAKKIRRQPGGLR